MKSTFVGNQTQTRIGVDDPGLTQLRVKRTSEPPRDSYLGHGSDFSKVYIIVHLGECYNLINVLQ